MSVINLHNTCLLKMMAEEPDLLLLDVRTPEEFSFLGHIPGAQLMPLHTIPAGMSMLDPQRKIVIICEHGVRSRDASQYLVHHGFQQVYQLISGMSEWNGPRVYSSDDASSADTVSQSTR